jgi:predicted  nucleic acid-binding Zn-ribbon protein
VRILHETKPALFPVHNSVKVIHDLGVHFPLYYYPTASIISIMSLPLKLFQLQKIDSQLDQANMKVKEIDLILNDNTEMAQAQEQVKVLEDRKDAALKKQQRAEEDLHSHRIKIEQSESTLYGGKISNPKELQDLQNEVASLKRYLSTLEDRVLDAMLEVEEITDQHQKAMQALENIHTQEGKRNEALLIDRSKLLIVIERLNVERNVFVGSIPADELDRYNQLRRSRRGVAVAQVIDHTCAACGSTLSASLLQNASSLNQIAFCDTCGRILYGGK